MEAQTQPQFARGKTYQGRRGRKTYSITGIYSDGLGGHRYDITTSSDEELKVWEVELLERARLVARKADRVWLSASQISTFRRCKRKWAFSYIDGEIEGGSDATEFGIEVHAVIEKYLKTGLWEGAADAVACAQQGKHMLPKPTTADLGIEKEFFISVFKGTGWIMGYIDVMVPPTVRCINPSVIDHKTTKDLRYAETTDSLKENIQANIYGKWAMEEYRSDEVKVSWRYHCARPSRSKKAVKGRPRNMGGFRPVGRIKSREEINEQWQGIMVDAAEMIGLSKDLSITAADVDGNEFACGDYGGCPFKGEQCKMAPSSLGALVDHHTKVAHSKAPTQENTMGNLMDIINKSKNKAAAAPAHEPEVAPPAQPEPAVKSALYLATERALKERQMADGATGINPPPVVQTELDPELAQALEKPVNPLWIERLAKGKKIRATGEQEWRDTQGAVEPPAEAFREVASTVPGTSAPVVDLSAHVAVPGTPPASVPKPQMGKAGGLFILLVDGQPAKGAEYLSGQTTLSELLRPAKDAVQKMKEVPYWNLLKFREGETLLAGCAQQMLSEDRPKGIVLADSNSTEWKACGDVLTEMADVVIRGNG